MIKMETKKVNKKIDEDLDFLKCHIFRLFQRKLEVNKLKCLNIFKKNKLFNFIEDNYKFMCFQQINIKQLFMNRLNMNSRKVTDEQKDFIATEMLRLVVENIKAKEKKSFEAAFSKVVKSNAYDMLYDFDTGMWGEGPRYIATYI